jgi:hypothetical protein
MERQEGGLTQRTRAPEKGGRGKREAGNMDGQDGGGEVELIAGMEGVVL